MVLNRRLVLLGGASSLALAACATPAMTFASSTPSPIGEWRALITKDGWRAMRLNAIGQARPAVFETLRGVVLQDWTDATLSEQRSTAVRVLTKKYQVKFEGAAP